MDMLSDLLRWLGQLHVSKTLALLLLFPTFCAIVLYVLTNRRRGQRLESYKYIPLEDEQDDASSGDKRS